MSAEEAFTQVQGADWGPNFPKNDDEIDVSDIPEQDFSGPDVVRGKYREFALASQGFVQLDPDIRPAFRDTQSVNRALRGLIAIAKNTSAEAAKRSSTRRKKN